MLNKFYASFCKAYKGYNIV